MISCPRSRSRSVSWPGNVRELRNLVEATLATGEVSLIEPPSSADPSKAGDPIAAVLPLDYKTARGAVLSQFESRFLQHILGRASGNVARAAREAKMDRSHLMDLLKRNRIE